MHSLSQSHTADKHNTWYHTNQWTQLLLLICKKQNSSSLIQHHYNLTFSPAFLLFCKQLAQRLNREMQFHF